MPANNTPVPARIPPQAAVTAARAMIGNSCTDELALDVVETIRPHLEYPYVALIQSLRIDLEAANLEIERLRAQSGN